MNKFEYKNLTPFKWFVLENFPFIEADFDALTDWQLFCKLGKEINKIIDSQNVVGTEMEKFSQAFIELQNYVDNYFKNLDVQDEINNKLNEMAEDGTLQEIISAYLNSKAIFGFDNVQSMKNSINLINGSYAKTLGTNTYNDGLGNFYKIREILNTDVVDNINIIPLNNYNNLIAELIPNAYINDILQQIQLINNKIDIEKNKNYYKLVMVGDSYCEQNIDGDITKWYWEIIRDTLKLQDNQTFFKGFQSGAGFGNGLFLKKLQDAVENLEDKNSVTDILICGGWNDSDIQQPYGPDAVFYEQVRLFNNYVRQNFPNARITLAHISWGNPLQSNNFFNIYDHLTTSLNRYKNICNLYGWRFLNGAENILHIYNNEYWQADGNHPNQKGETLLGENLITAFLNGSINIYRIAGVNAIASGICSELSHPSFYSVLDNDICFLANTTNNNGTPYFVINQNIACNGGTTYEIATINSEEMLGYSSYSLTNIPIYMTGTFNEQQSVYEGLADIWLEAGKLKIRPTAFSGGNRLESFNCQYLWIPCIKLISQARNS